MNPRKRARLHVDIDALAKLVKAKHREANARAGRELSQGEFGRLFGLERGQVSKLVTGGYSKDTARWPPHLEDAVIAMVGELPQLYLADLPTDVNEVVASGSKGARDVSDFLAFAHGTIDQSGRLLPGIKPDLRGWLIQQGTEHLSAWAAFVKHAADGVVSQFDRDTR